MNELKELIAGLEDLSVVATLMKLLVDSDFFELDRNAVMAFACMVIEEVAYAKSENAIDMAKEIYVMVEEVNNSKGRYMREGH